MIEHHDRNCPTWDKYEQNPNTMRMVILEIDLNSDKHLVIHKMPDIICCPWCGGKVEGKPNSEEVE